MHRRFYHKDFGFALETLAYVFENNSGMTTVHKTVMLFRFRLAI